MTNYDPTKLWIETHHRKGLFLSFQKILKFLRLDKRLLKLWLLKDVELSPPLIHVHVHVLAVNECMVSPVLVWEECGGRV